MSTQVSLLHAAARTRAGKVASAEVVGRAEITGSLVTSEAWSPTLYKSTRRLAADFEQANVLAFDVDEDMALEEACFRFLNYRHIIGTSVNHQLVKNAGLPNEKPACDRYRIILFLSSPITTAADYKHTLAQVASQLGIPVDSQASDAARWFIPCREVVSESAVGLFVDPLTAPLPAARRQPSTTSAVASKGKLSRATRDFLAQEPAADGWHKSFFKACVDFKEQGYSQEEAEARLVLASPEGLLDATDLEQLEDVYLNRGGALEVRPAWPVMLPANKDGFSRPSPTAPANQRYLLTGLLGYSFRVNLRREVIYFTSPEQVNPLPIGDLLLARLNTAAREHGISAGESLRDLIATIAHDNAYDPILDPLRALTWDGGRHIDALFETIQLPANTTPDARAQYALFLRRWLIGVVTKVFHPGAQNNVLVFQGEQAAGKSRWLKRLAQLWPEGFGEGHVNPDDKDHELRHIDNFIWHVAEFDSTTSKKEVGALKDYFTKDTVNVRRPYSRLPIVGQSICSFCASVNSHEFLHDATGNRRYLVIPVIGVNADHSVDIAQVMAEAKAAMLAGERQWFTRDEIDQVNSLNSYFLSKEEYLEILEENAKPGEDELSITAIMDLIGFDEVTLTRPIRGNIRTVLERKRIPKKSLRGVTVFMIDGAALKAAIAPRAPIRVPTLVNPTRKES